MTPVITITAPAKLNLFLSVGPRRSDGFHEIETVFQAVSLHDTLTIAHSERFHLSVTPEGSAPEDETNLVVRAARALWGAIGRTPGADVTLSKSIPSEAGLAGGSADGAAALIGLSELWDARLSKKSLEKIGASLGSDVPFCVRGGTAAGRGRGEILSPLPNRATLWWVIVVPQITLSTPAVYAAFDSISATPVLRDPFELADALAKGNPHEIAPLLSNDLREAALTVEPSLSAVEADLKAAGALAVVLCGSGSGWAALCADEEDARAVATRMSPDMSAKKIFVAHSLNEGPRLTRS
ncbi:MAG: 4-(cytidine 5'-diphospho)-2-C-methyl-D-erythritol kinase [Actinomycetota bacterium]